MSKVNEKWNKTFPPSIGNQTRPQNGVDDTQPFETGGFPQFIDNDPVASYLQNAMMTQAMSNDARLNEKINNSSAALDAHKKDPTAHANGISGNAASATKLKNTRNIKLTGKATGTASFDGTADASISVIDVTADRCVGNSATATQTTAGAPNGGAADLVKGTMAGGDNFRIRVGGKDDNGWAEIATADEGTEAIKVAQYTGAFAKKVREASLLDTAGNTSFPGKVTATNGFSGHLYGKADTAGRADVATSADAVTWGHVTEKPAAYPPAGHNHDSSYPSTTGTRASGTWGISISGNSASSNVAKLVGKDGGTGGGMKFHWSGQGGQPTWLWGGSNGTDMYVYNPSNFSVNYAKSAGAVAWGNVTGKPATFPASSHNHDSNYPGTTGARATGTWKISVTGNAATATNADKLDGAHLADIYRHIGGRVQPSMTALMDRVAMCKAANASAADINANIAKINKSSNWTQNIWNDNTGVRAYGGDFGFKSYNQSSILLRQDFRNFDKILIHFTNDDGSYDHHIVWDSWLLWWALQNSWRVDLTRGATGGGFWTVYGSNSGRGNDKHNNRYSSPTILQGCDQNCGIIEIYGLNY